jgi:hypothetical protein
MLLRTRISPCSSSTLALSVGCWRRALFTATITKGSRLSLRPSSEAYSRRLESSAVTSASSTTVKCTVVCTERCSASAIFRRTPRNGMRCAMPSGESATAGASTGSVIGASDGSVGCGARLTGVVEVAAGVPEALRTSPAVMRPPRPEPLTSLRSTPISRASRRTAGVARARPGPLRVGGGWRIGLANESVADLQRRIDRADHGARVLTLLPRFGVLGLRGAGTDRVGVAHEFCHRFHNRPRASRREGYRPRCRAAP